MMQVKKHPEQWQDPLLFPTESQTPSPGTGEQGRARAGTGRGLQADPKPAGIREPITGLVWNFFFGGGRKVSFYFSQKVNKMKKGQRKTNLVLFGSGLLMAWVRGTKFKGILFPQGNYKRRMEKVLGPISLNAF